MNFGKKKKEKKSFVYFCFPIMLRLNIFSEDGHLPFLVFQWRRKRLKEWNWIRSIDEFDRKNGLDVDTPLTHTYMLRTCYCNPSKFGVFRAFTMCLWAFLPIPFQFSAPFPFRPCRTRSNYAQYVSKIVIALWENQLTMMSFFTLLRFRPLAESPVVAMKALTTLMKV